MTVIALPATADHTFNIPLSMYAHFAEGLKTFKYCTDDEGQYGVGQSVELLTTSGEGLPSLHRVVTYVLRNRAYGLPPGHAVLALQEVGEPPTVHEKLTRETVRAVINSVFGRWSYPVMQNPTLDRLEIELVRALHPQAPKPPGTRFKVLRELIDMFGPMPPQYRQALDDQHDAK